MKISINKEVAETIAFKMLNEGSLFQDPDLDDSPLYIKTDEGDSIDLLTGHTEDQFLPDYEVIDATDKYVIVDL